MRTALIAVALVAMATGAAAQPAGESFTAVAEARVPLPPKAAYRAFARIERWWNPQHTYSGSAASLRLAPEAGGCFCERLPGGGSVEHMRVVYAAPGESLRLVGGLGPLQALPATGVMTAAFAADGAQTKVTLTYVVAGPGTSALAGPVQSVLAEQLARYAAEAAP